MRVKVDDTIAYRDHEMAILHGVGIAVSVTESEYTILWARRGSKRYKRAILDPKLLEIFQHEGKGKRMDLPREKRLRLGTSTRAVSFNGNYDQNKVQQLCDTLKTSQARSARHVVEGLADMLVTNRVAKGNAAKSTFRHLAALCSGERLGDATDAARQISQELFFGYVIQESDFDQHQ